MRAILIDPFTKTISEVSLEGDPWQAAKRLVHQRTAEDDIYGKLLERVSLGGRVVGLIDESGLMRTWDYQAFFKLVGDTSLGGDEDASLTIGGYMVLISEAEDGEFRQLNSLVTTSGVSRIVRWMEPTDVDVAAPTITPTDENMNPVGPAEPLDGKSERWTYDDNPANPKRG